MKSMLIAFILLVGALNAGDKEEPNFDDSDIQTPEEWVEWVQKILDANIND
jgi:hypothetical protein